MGAHPRATCRRTMAREVIHSHVRRQGATEREIAMSVISALHEVLATRPLEFPKERRGYDPIGHCAHLRKVMKGLFADSFWESETALLVECTHKLRPPATAGEIDNVAKSLGMVVPEQLRQFWE